MTLVIATYGALVATGSVVVAVVALGWQIRTSRRGRQTLLNVSHYLLMEPAERIEIRVVNLSDHPVRVVDVALRTQPDSESWTFAGRPRSEDDTLPGTIEPHDAGVVHVERVEIGVNRDMSEPFVARVTVGSGEVFFSEEKPLTFDKYVYYSSTQHRRGPVARLLRRGRGDHR